MTTNPDLFESMVKHVIDEVQKHCAISGLTIDANGNLCAIADHGCAILGIDRELIQRALDKWNGSEK